jgi:hypothetical protein
MAPDASVASWLNLNGEGKHVMKTHNGLFLDEDGMRIEHIMQTVTGVQKGVRTILSERNLLPSSGLSLVQVRKVLANQPDFMHQKEWLIERVLEGADRMHHQELP